MLNADKKLTNNGSKLGTETSLQLLPLIMQNIPQAIFWKDQNLVYLGCNQAFAEDAGFGSPEEVIGKTDFDMPWKDQAEAYRADDRRVLDSGEAKLNYEEPQTTPAGATTWLRTSKIPVCENGRVVAILGMYEDITERKQAELAILFRDRALASSLNAVIILDMQDNKPIYANESLLRMTGYTFEEIQQITLADITGSLTELPKIRTAVQQQGFFVGEELIRRKDGSTFPTTFFTSLIKDAKGQPIAIQSSFLDISELKQAETLLLQSERMFQALFEMSPDAVTLIDPYDPSNEWPIVDCNPAACQINGYTRAELIGQPINIVNAPTDTPIDRTEYLKRLHEEGTVKYEVLHRRKDGTIFPVEVSTTLIQLGERELLLGMDRDITERKQVERDLAEKEERFKRFTEATFEGLVFHDAGKVIDANPAATAMFGFSAVEEAIGRNLLEFILPEYHEQVLKQMQLGTVAPYEIQCVRLDGTRFPVETSTRTYQVGERMLRATSLRDITERKKAEAQLQQEKSFSDAIINGLPGTFYLFDLEGRMLRWNKQYELVSGYSAEEIPSMSVIDTLVEEDRAAALAAIQQALAEGQGATEATFITKDGTKIPYYFAGQRLQIDGQTYMAGTGMDLTERRQVERALRESQKFLQIVMDNIPQSIFWKDNNLTYLGCNSAFAADAGFTSPNDIIGKTDWDMPWKDQAEAYRADDGLVIKNGIPKLNYEEPQTTPDGRTSWLRTSKIPLYDVDGNPFAVLGMYEDITERKQSEAALQQEQALSDAIINGLPGIFFLFDLEGRMVRWNKQYEQVLGYTTEEMAVRNALDPIADEDKERTTAAIQTAFMEGQGIVEARVVTKDGKQISYYFVGQRLQLDDQLYIAGTGIDITERKQLEEGLLLRDRALASSLSAVLVVGLDFKPIYVNESFLKMTGYTYEEAMRLTITDLSAYPEGLKRIDEATRAQGFFTGEETLKRRDGSIFPTDFSTSYIADDQGKPIAIQTAFVDITARKQLEQQIQTAFERRGLQVQLSTQVSQSIASASSLSELYDRVVTQIKEQFGYYHTQLLRYDPAQEAVMLVVGYGDVGRQMLADGHRMPMGEGLIGTAAATGETILRSVLTNDPDWHPNPLLPETKGEIAVPIKIGDVILGVLDVQSNEAGSLDADDQLLLEGLCGQIATAIESTRLRQEMADRLEEINRLYRAMSHEGWQTYRQTANLPTSFLYDQAGLRPAQEADLTQELFSNVPLAIPGGEVIGTLSVADDARRPLTPDDETFLLQVSEQLALALESARLFEQTQSALSEVERRASELETVAQLSATTASVLDPDQLLQTVVELTKERFGLYHAHIYVYEEAWNTLMLAAGAGEVGRKLVAEQHAIPLTVEQSLVTRAARERRAIIVNDVNTEPDFLPNPLLPETSAELAVPMVAGDKLLGVFDVQSNNPAGFTVEDANIYVTLATQVAVALQNARLYVEQAALVTQLRELDRLKSSFLANMSHELRTPLNSILGFADVIIEELDGPLTENMANDLRLIQKNGQHLLHLINDVLDMAKIEAGRMNLNPEKFTACEVLEEVTSITSTLASEKNLALFITEDTDREVKIFADRTRLRQVMINLVNNAIKFTETGKISLKVAPLEGARILISVKDTGLGIPADKLEAVFQEFTQVDSSSTRKAGGTGLGLPISRKLVEMHGGRLWAESSGIPGEGSTFFVELPVEARITETVEKQAK